MCRGRPERRRRRVVWGLGRGVPSQPTRRSGERRELPQWGPGQSLGRKRIPNALGIGDMAVSPPQNFFIFELKMVRFGAFWVLFFQFGCLFKRKITAEFDKGNGTSATIAEHSA